MQRLLLSVIVLGALVSCGPVEEPTSPSCSFSFEGTVRRGPNVGLSLRGQLYLQKVDTEHWEGGLIVPAAGGQSEQLVRATAEPQGNNGIRLSFDLGAGKTVSGTGVMPDALDTCPTPFEGELLGFAPGDAGDWITSFFPPPAPTQCTTVTVRDPRYLSGRISVASGGSCITVPGGSLRMFIPFSTTSHGPYSLSFDESGTRLRTTLLSADVMPAGSCRLAQAQNPNGMISTSVSFCR